VTRSVQRGATGKGLITSEMSAALNSSSISNCSQPSLPRECGQLCHKLAVIGGTRREDAPRDRMPERVVARGADDLKHPDFRIRHNFECAQRVVLVACRGTRIQTPCSPQTPRGHSFSRPQLRTTTPSRDHSFSRPQLHATTASRDHSVSRPQLLATTASRAHSFSRPQFLATTASRDHSFSRPQVLATTGSRDHSFS